MRTSDAFTVVLASLAILCFSGAILNGGEPRFSLTQPAVQPPSGNEKITHLPASQLILSNEKSALFSTEMIAGETEPEYMAQAVFSRRLEGGILLRFEFGLIVVKPAASPGSLQPTALTTDAVITSSVRSKIAGQSQLPPGDFEIQTDDGVVTIRSKADSLDEAAVVINLALCVPDVREIVYTMPGERIVSACRRMVFKCRARSSFAEC